LLDVTAFAALIKRKRGEARLTQETLAQDVFGDSARKADISRLENAKVANPQEATVQKICTALNISAAEMEPIRQSRLSAAQLDQIPTLSRKDLQTLAAMFEIVGAFDMGDEELRGYLEDKANEYRALRQQIATMDDTITEIAQLKDAAEDAAKALDFAEVEKLLASADFAETAINAQTKITRANNALIRNRTEQAFDILAAVADSFRSSDPMAPAQIRLQLEDILYSHGLRYGSDGMALSERMIRDALADLPKEETPQLWADAQNSLAVALANQGTRTDGPKGADLLAEAVTACRAVLDVYTQHDYPEQWATTLNNLGNALQEQGSRTDGLKGADLLAEAVSAYRAALEVFTRQDHPVQWATTQNNLGNALRGQGIRTDGLKGADLLAQAVTAFRAALEVRTRQDHPVQWATTQNNLGGALRNQGTRTDGPKGTDLLAQAVTAYRAALDVYTRQDHPVDWAMTQNNLGNALGDQGNRTNGPKGANLLAQAVTAYRAALEVRTRQDHPVQWATTQLNIALTQRDLSRHDSCPDPHAALEAALVAVDDALTVYDPDHMSYDHGTATRLRDAILADIAALPPE